MARRASLVLFAIALLGALASPASAQEEPPPLSVDVESIHVPNTRGKLVSKGVRVTATCSASCVLVVKVKLPASVAAKLGLSKPVIGTGVADAVAGESRTLFAKVRAGAARRLADYHGSKGLKIDVQALP